MPGSMHRRTFLHSVAGTAAVLAVAPRRALALMTSPAPLKGSSAEPKRYLVVHEHVAFAPDGTLCVFHPERHHLEHRGIYGMDAHGRISQLGSRPGELNYPTAVAFDSRGRIHVADRGNHRINVYSPGGRFAAHIDEARGRRLSYPRGLAVDDADNLYVADSGANRVHVFSPELKFVRSLEAESDPVKLAASLPTSIAIAPDGRIHVADLGERCIEVYGKSGKLVARYGRSDGLTAPRSLAIRADGTVFVADAAAQSVFVFGSDGRLAERLEPRTADRSAVVPRHVAVDGNGLLYVTAIAPVAQRM
jgi:DNA-binding beta-propeller fold protein YncE